MQEGGPVRKLSVLPFSSERFAGDTIGGEKQFMTDAVLLA